MPIQTGPHRGKRALRIYWLGAASHCVLIIPGAERPIRNVLNWGAGQAYGNAAALPSNATWGLTSHACIGDRWLLFDNNNSQGHAAGTIWRMLRQCVNEADLDEFRMFGDFPVQKSFAINGNSSATDPADPLYQGGTGQAVAAFPSPMHSMRGAWRMEDGWIVMEEGTAASAALFIPDDQSVHPYWIDTLAAINPAWANTAMYNLGMVIDDNLLLPGTNALVRIAKNAAGRYQAFNSNAGSMENPLYVDMGDYVLRVNHAAIQAIDKATWELADSWANPIGGTAWIDYRVVREENVLYLFAANANRTDYLRVETSRRVASWTNSAEIVSAGSGCEDGDEVTFGLPDGSTATAIVCRINGEAGTQISIGGFSPQSSESDIGGAFTAEGSEGSGLVVRVESSPVWEYEGTASLVPFSTVESVGARTVAHVLAIDDGSYVLIGNMASSVDAMRVTLDRPEYTATIPRPAGAADANEVRLLQSPDGANRQWLLLSNAAQTVLRAIDARDGAQTLHAVPSGIKAEIWHHSETESARNFIIHSGVTNSTPTAEFSVARISAGGLSIDNTLLATGTARRWRPMGRAGDQVLACDEPLAPAAMWHAPRFLSMRKGNVTAARCLGSVSSNAIATNAGRQIVGVPAGDRIWQMSKATLNNSLFRVCRRGRERDGAGAPMILFTSADSQHILANRQTSYLALGFVGGALSILSSTGAATNPAIDGTAIAGSPVAIDYDVLMADVGGTMIFKKCYDHGGQPLWALDGERRVPALNVTGSASTGAHRFGYNRLAADLLGRTNNRWGRTQEDLAPPWLRIRGGGERPYDLLFAAWDRSPQSVVVDTGLTTIPPRTDNGRWQAIGFDVLQGAEGNTSFIASNETESGLARMSIAQNVGAILFRDGLLDAYGITGVVKRLNFLSAGLADPVYWDAEEVAFAQTDYAPSPVRLAFFVDRALKVYGIGEDITELSVVETDNVRFSHDGRFFNRVNFRDIYLRGRTRTDSLAARGRVEALSVRAESLVASSVTLLGPGGSAVTLKVAGV